MLNTFTYFDSIQMQLKHNIVILIIIIIIIFYKTKNNMIVLYFNYVSFTA